MAASNEPLTRSAPIFAALGDETRLRLVARLCAGGPQSIARLTAGSKVTRQAVTKHLLVLADAGLARAVRHGRESHWALEPGQLEVARRYIELISERWTRRLEALERHLDSMPEIDYDARTTSRRRSPAPRRRRPRPPRCGPARPR